MSKSRADFVDPPSPSDVGLEVVQAPQTSMTYEMQHHYGSITAQRRALAHPTTTEHHADEEGEDGSRTHESASAVATRASHSGTPRTDSLSPSVTSGNTPVSGTVPELGVRTKSGKGARAKPAAASTAQPLFVGAKKKQSRRALHTHSIDASLVEQITERRRKMSHGASQQSIESLALRGSGASAESPTSVHSAPSYEELLLTGGLVSSSNTNNNTNDNDTSTSHPGKQPMLIESESQAFRAAEYLLRGGNRHVHENNSFFETTIKIPPHPETPTEHNAPTGPAVAAETNDLAAAPFFSQQQQPNPSAAAVCNNHYHTTGTRPFLNPGTAAFAPAGKFAAASATAAAAGDGDGDGTAPSQSEITHQRLTPQANHFSDPNSSMHNGSSLGDNDYTHGRADAGGTNYLGAPRSAIGYASNDDCFTLAPSANGTPPDRRLGAGGRSADAFARHDTDDDDNRHTPHEQLGAPPASFTGLSKAFTSGEAQMQMHRQRADEARLQEAMRAAGVVSTTPAKTVGNSRNESPSPGSPLGSGAAALSPSALQIPAAFADVGGEHAAFHQGSVPSDGPLSPFARDGGATLCRCLTTPDCMQGANRASMDAVAHMLNLNSQRERLSVSFSANTSSALQHQLAALKSPMDASIVMKQNRAALITELERRRTRLRRQLAQLQREATQNNIFALVRANNTSQLQYLLEQKLVNVNERDYNGCTPLHVAASEGSYAIVRVLVSFSADVLAVDKLGRTPLDCAALNRQSGVGRYLLQVIRSMQQPRLESSVMRTIGEESIYLAAPEVTSPMSGDHDSRSSPHHAFSTQPPSIDSSLRPAEPTSPYIVAATGSHPDPATTNPSTQLIVAPSMSAAAGGVTTASNHSAASTSPPVPVVGLTPIPNWTSPFAPTGSYPGEDAKASGGSTATPSQSMPSSQSGSRPPVGRRTSRSASFQAQQQQRLTQHSSADLARSSFAMTAHQLNSLKDIGNSTLVEGRHAHGQLLFPSKGTPRKGTAGAAAAAGAVSAPPPLLQSAKSPDPVLRSDPEVPLPEVPSAMAPDEVDDEHEKDDVSYSRFTTVSDTVPFIVCMCGLPGRGKSFIGRRLVRYMNWKGVPCRVFNAGDYRRQLLGVEGTAGAAFFDPDNPQGKELRERMAELACEDLVRFIASKPLAVGILDATNTTTARRRKLKDFFEKQGKEQNINFRLLFIESVCTDETIITENILRSKCDNDDFKEVKDTSAVIAEFRNRIVQYEKVYETLEPQEGLSFIKIINVKHHVMVHNVPAGLGSRIVFFLMNLHPVPYRIYIALNGETVGDTQGVYGGEERLTERGERYAHALKRFIQERYVPHMVVLHATNLSTLNTLRPLTEDESGSSEVTPTSVREAARSAGGVRDFAELQKISDGPRDAQAMRMLAGGDTSYISHRGSRCASEDDDEDKSSTCSGGGSSGRENGPNDDEEDGNDEVLCPVPGLDNINFGRFSGQSAQWVAEHYPRLSSILFQDTVPGEEAAGGEGLSASAPEMERLTAPLHFSKVKDALEVLQRRRATKQDPIINYCTQFPSGESCRQVNVRLEPALMAVMRTPNPVFVIAPNTPAEGVLSFFADVMPEWSPSIRIPRDCVVELGVKGDLTIHPLLPEACIPKMATPTTASPALDLGEIQEAIRRATVFNNSSNVAETQPTAANAAAVSDLGQA